MMLRRVGTLAVKCGALQAERLRSAGAVSQVQLARCFSDKKQPVQHEVQDDVYNKPQGFTIRVMFGISTVNLMVSDLSASVHVSSLDAVTITSSSIVLV